jgi:hypothetical protein
MRSAARVAAAVGFSSRQLRTRLRRLVLDLDRTPGRVRDRITAQPMAGVLCCVYRARNAGCAEALIDGAQRAGLAARLWALDAVVPSLAPWTVGVGPGQRQQLLNRLVPDGLDGWVVLADDDVVFDDGALALLLTIATRLGLDLAQPAHDSMSRASTEFVRAKPRVGARRTGFVEIGPIVALDAKAHDALLPLDESLGMGWGQDYLWARTFDGDGLSAGIVDAVRMRHLPQLAPTYDREQEMAHLDACLARAGYESHTEPMVTHATVRARDL